MSVLFAGGVAVAYAAGVIGLHRLNIYRMKRAAGGFPSLHWIDWDTLLSGLLTTSASPVPRSHRRVVGQGPLPRALASQVTEAERSRFEWLCALVEGHEPSLNHIQAAGFSGGEARWLQQIAGGLKHPLETLKSIEDAPISSAAEVYWRTYLRLRHATHVFNLEWVVFDLQRQLAAALHRFGDEPSLYYVRALSFSLLGANQKAIDDLARAVFFSQQKTFYAEAVLASPYIAENRPALALQCTRMLDDACVD